MEETKFIKKVDGLAEYEIGDDEETVKVEDKEYKAQKIERRD